MWSYSGNPAHNNKDLVRFLIGDTDETEKLLTDEEISYNLSLYNNAAPNAAIRCCESIINKFSRMVDETAGQVSLKLSQRCQNYRQTLADLKTRLSIDDMTPICGGISVTDKNTVEANGDRVKPEFSKHMMEDDQIAPWVSSIQGDTQLGPGEN